jgi:hypothetical protein
MPRGEAHLDGGYCLLGSLQDEAIVGQAKQGLSGRFQCSGENLQENPPSLEWRYEEQS